MNYDMITPLELDSWINPINTHVVTNLLYYISWLNHKFHGLMNRILPYYFIATDFNILIESTI